MSIMNKLLASIALLGFAVLAQPGSAQQLQGLNSSSGLICSGCTLTSPILAGQPTSVTFGYYDNSTNIATTAQVQSALHGALQTVSLNIGATGGGTYSFNSQGSGGRLLISTSGGVITSISSVVVAGSGYAVGDIITLQSGNYDNYIRVTSVGGGGSLSGLLILAGGTGNSNGFSAPAVAAITAIPGAAIITGTLTSNATVILTGGTPLFASTTILVENNVSGAFTSTYCVAPNSSTNSCSGGNTVIVPESSSFAVLRSDGNNNVNCIGGVCSANLGTPSAINLTNATGSLNSIPIGATIASTGAFTTLSASSTVSGSGFSNYLASPPAIGGTAAAAGNFTTGGFSGNQINGGNLTLGANPNLTSSNGSLNISSQSGMTEFSQTTAAFGISDTSAGTNLQLFAWQNIGGNLNLSAWKTDLSGSTLAYQISRGTTYNISSHSRYFSTSAGSPIQGEIFNSNGTTFGTGSITGVNGDVGLTKVTASANAPGAGTLKLEVVTGTNAGTCKLIAYAGTSSTATTIIDNVGAGC